MDLAVIGYRGLRRNKYAESQCNPSKSIIPVAAAAVLPRRRIEMQFKM